MDKDRILALDTETTGVGPNAEILQLSVIDGEGAMRMNQYFRPKKNSSWPEAEKVNHISPAMVSKCPFILDHKEEIQEMLGNAEAIVGYNLPSTCRCSSRAALPCPIQRKPSTSTSCPLLRKIRRTRSLHRKHPLAETHHVRQTLRLRRRRLARQPRRHESDHLLLLENDRRRDHEAR